MSANLTVASAKGGEGVSTLLSVSLTLVTASEFCSRAKKGKKASVFFTPVFSPALLYSPLTACFLTRFPLLLSPPPFNPPTAPPSPPHTRERYGVCVCVCVFLPFFPPFPLPRRKMAFISHTLSSNVR